MIKRPLTIRRSRKREIDAKHIEEPYLNIPIVISSEREPGELRSRRRLRSRAASYKSSRDSVGKDIQRLPEEGRGVQTPFRRKAYEAHRSGRHH